MNAHSDGRGHAESLVSALGAQLGIPRLALEQDNTVTLSFNEEALTLGYDNASDGLTLFSLVDRIPGPLGPEGLAGLIELNTDLFGREQSCLLYNQTTLLVGALYRVDAWTVKSDGLLPWIDSCVESLGRMREEIWVLLGADRAEKDEDDGETVIRL